MKKILLPLLVLAAIAATGWYVWDKNKKEPSATGQQSTTQENNKESDPSEGGKYLVIKEWNVRFLLPEEYRQDIYYSVIDDRKIRFGSQKYSQLYEDCKAENTGLGGIYRKKEGDVVRKDEEFLPASFKTIEVYEFHIIANSTLCKFDAPEAEDINKEENLLNRAILETTEAIT